jgi:hypothetical protein
VASFKIMQLWTAAALGIEIYWMKMTILLRQATETLVYFFLLHVRDRSGE